MPPAIQRVANFCTNGTAMKKPSKKVRANRRKAKLGAKRRKQRARAGH
jgi:hypothetical protein